MGEKGEGRWRKTDMDRVRVDVRKVRMRRARLRAVICMWLLSNRLASRRRRTSSMRGCCHAPGVERAGDEGGCCLGVPGWELLDGVRLETADLAAARGDGEGLA